MIGDLDFSKIIGLNFDDQAAQEVITEYCRIDTANLDQALQRHPALYAYAVSHYEILKVRETQAKWDFEAATARAFTIVVSQKGTGKWTVAEVEKELKTTPLVTGAQQAYNNASMLVARMKGLVSGLEHRRDMLVQLSARQRAEM